MSRFRIELKDIRFRAHIGVSEQERLVGNEFVVNVAYSVPAENFVSESLQTTVSYADIFEIVKRRMMSEWLLLESAAQAISTDIQKAFPQIDALSVSLTKTSVPLTGMDGTATVRYDFLKNV